MWGAMLSRPAEARAAYEAVRPRKHGEVEDAMHAFAARTPWKARPTPDGRESMAPHGGKGFFGEDWMGRQRGAQGARGAFALPARKSYRIVRDIGAAAGLQ